jgi:drug/metabolite transporter (DMT)-like permease
MYTISRGGAIVLVWPLSVLAYGESVVLSSVIGTAIVFAGIALSSVDPNGPSGPSGPNGPNAKGRTDRSALAWAAACAASIAGYHLSYKAALLHGGNPSAVFALALALATSINVARLGTEGRRVVVGMYRSRMLRVAMMGAICGGSFLILMEALARGGSGYVLTLRNTSVLFATGLAFAIGEHPRRPHTIGAALVAAGAVVMALQGVR